MRFSVIIVCGLLALGVPVAFAKGNQSDWSTKSAYCDTSPEDSACYPKAPKKPKPTPKPVYQPMVSATVYPGSVKANVIRIARAHGWNTVVWNATSDYRWYGTTRITANNLSSLFSKMLYDYPLQAIFYHGNHVLVIGPRNLP